MRQKRMYPSRIKKQVKQLILDKKSYKEITQITGVPKSTISTWFGKSISRPWNKEVRLRHLAGIRKLALATLKAKWKRIHTDEAQIVKQAAQKELLSCPLDNTSFYKSLLSMLYWAEGSKSAYRSGTTFANTDPNLAQLYITLLRKSYPVDEDKFSIRLHLHYYHPAKKTKDFWSKKLHIPLTQFTKVYIKKRSRTKRFRKNFAGICFIYYGNSRIRRELLELGAALQKAIPNHAPVAQRIEHLIADQKAAGSNPAGRT